MLPELIAAKVKVARMGIGESGNRGRDPGERETASPFASRPH